MPRDPMIPAGDVELFQDWLEDWAEVVSCPCLPHPAMLPHQQALYGYLISPALMGWAVDRSLQAALDSVIVLVSTVLLPRSLWFHLICISFEYLWGFFSFYNIYELPVMGFVHFCVGWRNLCCWNLYSCTVVLNLMNLRRLSWYSYLIGISFP